MFIYKEKIYYTKQEVINNIEDIIRTRKWQDKAFKGQKKKLNLLSLKLDEQLLDLVKNDSRNRFESPCIVDLRELYNI